MCGTSRFALLVSKFRGSLVGSLIGDCIGTLPEIEQVLGSGISSSSVGVQRFFAIPAGQTDEGSALPYSIRTRMLRCAGESLMHCREFDKQDLTHRLIHENAVNKAFPNWKDSLGQSAGLMPSGINQLARQKHFNDSVALRTTPIAMYYYGNLDKALEAAKDSGELLHPSLDNGMGAILHCSAVHLALQFDPMNLLNIDLFLDNLMEEIAAIETDKKSIKRTVSVNNKGKPTLRQLEKVRELLKAQNNIQAAIQKLKSDDNQPQSNSVAAAIYTFLKSQQERESSSTSQNSMERVLSNALSVSTSGDALAALSCSLAGAYHGIEVIPVSMRKRCQGLHETVKLGDRLALPFEAHPGLIEEKEISFVQRV
ncbi:ADP-ribose glycohydrolase ARH3 [Chamberlinius hualienensis]